MERACAPPRVSWSFEDRPAGVQPARRAVSPLAFALRVPYSVGPSDLEEAPSNSLPEGVALLLPLVLQDSNRDNEFPILVRLSPSPDGRGGKPATNRCSRIGSGTPRSRSFAYGTFLFAALTVALHVTAALFSIAAMTLLLLFIGIHNAWDTVTYIAIDRAAQEKEGGQESSARSKTAG